MPQVYFGWKTCSIKVYIKKVCNIYNLDCLGHKNSSHTIRFR